MAVIASAPHPTAAAVPPLAKRTGKVGGSPVRDILAEELVARERPKIWGSAWQRPEGGPPAHLSTPVNPTGRRCGCAS